MKLLSYAVECSLWCMYVGTSVCMFYIEGKCTRDQQMG